MRQHGLWLVDGRRLQRLQLALGVRLFVDDLRGVGVAQDLEQVIRSSRGQVRGRQVDGLLQLVRRRIHERVVVLQARYRRYFQLFQLFDQRAVVGRLQLEGRLQKRASRPVAVVEDVARRLDLRVGVRLQVLGVELLHAWQI